MAFGHWMEVVEGDVRLRLGPIKKEDAARFVAAEAGHGMQSYEVVRYLGHFVQPPTVQSEEEWWDKASTDKERIVWGVYVTEDDGETWTVIGSTMLHLHGYGQRRAESGFMLFDRAHWGKRIASTAHLGRTRFGFDELDLLAITSGAFAPNGGSNRALQGIGYVRTGTSYCEATVGGKPIDVNLYLLPNPAEEAWRYFWRRPEDEIPVEFREGRGRTRRTMERAGTAVRFL